MKFYLQNLFKFSIFSLTLFASCSIQAENKVIYENPSVVKVSAGDSVSSGLLVNQDKNDFYFIVSDHMFTGSTENICVFLDQSIYGLKAIIHHRGGESLDLALIRIHTDQIKRIENADVIKEAIYKEGDDLYAIGYNLVGEFLIKKGKLVYTLNKPLKGGYDVGVSANVEKGMSGGGIFDEKGKLIAITSIHADPLWDTQLYYESGEVVEEEKSALISKYSMGISSKRLTQYLTKQYPSDQPFNSSQCSE